MTRAAWFCPACQKYHAPHVDTCAGCSEGTEAAPWKKKKTFTPLVKPPHYPYPGTAGDYFPRHLLPTGTCQIAPFGIGTVIWNGQATTGGIQ